MRARAIKEQQVSYEVDANEERLYEEIRACDHWQDVIEIVADELLQSGGIKCSTKRAVQALVRLSALASRAMSQDDSPVYLALLDLVYTRVPEMKVSQLSATVVALAKLRVSVPPLNLASICCKAGTSAGQMTGRDLVGVLNSLASLKAKPEIRDMDSLGFRAYNLLRDQLTSSEVQPKETRDSSITPQGISLLFHSSASLGYMNSKLISTASEAALAHIDEFSPVGISNILWACGKLSHYNPKLVEACLNHVSTRSEGYQPREAATIMWSLVQLRHQPQEASRALLSILISRVSTINILDISSSLLCLATFSINPGKQSMAKISNRIIEILDKSDTKVPAQNVSVIFWALAMLGETSRPVFARLAGLLPALFEEGELTNEGLLRQAFQAYLCSKLDDADDQSSPSPSSSSSSSSLSFPPLLVDSMKRSWVSSMQQSASRSSSPFNKGPNDLVSDLVTKLRVKHDVRRVTRDQLALVDIALRPSEDRFVALQILKEHDVARNTNQMMGSTIFQRRILERNGWEVKYLFLKDLLTLEESEQPSFIAELLGHIGCKVTRSSSRSPRMLIPRGSEEEEDADIALRDPSNSRGPSKGSKGRGAR